MSLVDHTTVLDAAASSGDGRSKRAERTRRRLLEAAEEVFGELPYRDASVAEITRRAGVGQGTFYLHFPGKEAVFVELVRHIGRALRHSIAAAVHGLEDRKEIERAGLKAFIRFLQDHTKIYAIVREAQFVDPDVFREYYREFARGYMTGLEREIQSGRLRPLDSEVLAYSLMGIADFLGMRWVVWGDGVDVPPEVVDHVVDFVFHGMASAERPVDKSAHGA